MFDKMTIDGNEYYVITKVAIDTTNYIYLAECDEDDDITGNFYVYKDINGSYIKVTDSEELKRVLLVIVPQVS